MLENLSLLFHFKTQIDYFFFLYEQMSKFVSSTSPAKSPAVKWWQQAVQSFVTPYGGANEAPDPSTIFKTLQPFASEWLIHPDVALSEYTDTILSNIPILEEKGNSIVYKSCLQKLKEHFQPIWENLEAVNRKAGGGASPSDAKVLKTMSDSEEVDTLMEEVYQASGALFAMSTNYLIATALICHPKQFRKLVAANTKECASFRTSGSVEDIKSYILGSFTENEAPSANLSRKAPEKVKKIFLDSSSSSSSSESEPQEEEQQSQT